MKKLSLSSPYLKFSELRYVKESVKSEWVSTSGKYINDFEKALSKFTKSKYTIICNSGTSALHIALKLVGVKKNDEIIVPTLTFIATINSVIYNDASPIFMDSNNQFNIDIEKVINYLKKETYFKNGHSFNSKTNKLIRAIIVVHVWGNLSNLDKLVKICKKRNIKIVEDATEALGSKIHLHKKIYRHAGTIGDIGCSSFNGNKIITTGAGGAIFVKNKKLYKKGNYLISQAKDNNNKFIHDNIGFNYRMPNINAALGLSQIQNIKAILLKKKFIHDYYINYFSKNINYEILDISKPYVNNNWINILFIKNKKIKLNNLHDYLNSKNIEARYIWKLNHLQKPFLKYEKYKIKCALELVSSTICLPSSLHLGKKDLKYICDRINEFNKLKI